MGEGAHHLVAQANTVGHQHRSEADLVEGALDPVTEASVVERIAARLPDACIVASVHRMSLLEHFDRVVLMVDGCVLDSGTVPEVEARQPIFRDMVRREARAPQVTDPVSDDAAAA